MRILITGGAGFVGAALARCFRRDQPKAKITAFDNLHRRGSELNAASFPEEGVAFVHGDVRNPGDLEALPGNFDLLIEASAEPSVHAGLGGSPAYVLETNLVGTLNALEFARRRCATFLFLSTSRVYSLAPLRALPLRETPTRFEIGRPGGVPGLSARGIAEEFPTHLPRSLYGASKLASELLVQEYAESFGMDALVDRCGVIAGPGQFGKTDQGVFTLWVARHFFGGRLRYTGFGGKGKQVRDLLHPEDLYDLLRRQVNAFPRHRGAVFNVGGGREISTSLRELTDLCRKVTGREVPLTSDPRTSEVDIPLYLSDTSRVRRAYGWKPRRSVETIVREIHRWLAGNEGALRPLFV